MTMSKPDNKIRLGLYNFGIDMFEATQEETPEELVEWAGSHEGGVQAFVKESQERMELAVRKAKFALAKTKGKKDVPPLEVVSSEEAASILSANPDESPIAARNLKDEMGEYEKRAIASVIKSRKGGG